MAVLFTPLWDAEIVTPVGVSTCDVVIVKTGDAVAPAATVTEAGTPTPGSPLIKVTRMPPAGAGPFRVTLLAVDETPPTTDVGDSVKESSAMGVTVRFARIAILFRNLAGCGKTSSKRGLRIERR